MDSVNYKIEQALRGLSQDDNNISNYVEFILTDQGPNDSDCLDDQSEVKVHNTAMKKDTFYTLMYKMMDTHWKYHHKQYRELVVGDVHYHNYKNEEINIHTMVTNTIDNVDNKLCMLMQTRTKLSILSLPCTLNIYNDNVVRKMIFRVSNRVFVNFEHGMTGPNKYYKVYVNYNHDKDVDISNNISMIKNALTVLLN